MWASNGRETHPVPAPRPQSGSPLIYGYCSHNQASRIARIAPLGCSFSSPSVGTGYVMICPSVGSAWPATSPATTSAMADSKSGSFAILSCSASRDASIPSAFSASNSFTCFAKASFINLFRVSLRIDLSLSTLDIIAGSKRTVVWMSGMKLFALYFSPLFPTDIIMGILGS